MKQSRPPTAIIVLGAAQYDGRPSRVLAARLDHAAALAASYPNANIITVGGKLPGDRFTEAAVAKTYLSQHATLPVTIGRICAVQEGNSTESSLHAITTHFPHLASQSSIHIPRTVIVTDPLHAPRTYLLARMAGLNARVSPTRTCPQRFPQPAWWRYLLHEAGGLVIVCIARAASPRFSRAVAKLFHRIESKLRPSRKTRNQYLYARK